SDEDLPVMYGTKKPETWTLVRKAIDLLNEVEQREPTEIRPIGEAISILLRVQERLEGVYRYGGPDSDAIPPSNSGTLRQTRSADSSLPRQARPLALVGALRLRTNNLRSRNRSWTKR